MDQSNARTLDTKKSLLEEDIRTLLKSISNLPKEISLLVLYKLDYQQLNELCKYLTKNEEDQELCQINKYCQDYNFWAGYLRYLGYDLPRYFEEILQIIRRYKDRKAIPIKILKYLFFSDFPYVISPTKYFETYWRIHQVDKEEQKKFSKATLQQIALDLAYLNLQIEDQRWRSAVKKPRIFNIDVFLLPDINEPEWPKRTSIADFIEFLHKVDLAVPPHGFSTVDRWIEQLLDFNTFPSDGKIQEKDFRDHLLIERFEEQELRTLSFLPKEGDLVVIKVIKIKNGRGDKEHKLYYYVTQQKQLIKISTSEESEIYFPEEALSFLTRKNALTIDTIIALYRLNYYIKRSRRITYFKTGQRINFPEA